MALIIDQRTRTFTQTLLNFEGGLNTRDIDSRIRDTELSDIRNFTYDKKGALTLRGGFTKINTTAIGSDPIMSLGGYYKSGATEEFIATAGTSIYKYDSSTQRFTAIKTGLSGDGLVFGMHQYMNHFYMGNGTDPIQVYDGTNVWDIGYTKPASAPTASDGGAGSMSAGTYKYKVTFYYADGESNPCDSYAEVTIADSHQVSLSDIPTGNSRVTQRKIYRTTAGGTTYKLLTTISDNTTTTYTDNTPDSGLGADMDTDNDAPPACKYIVNHKGRLWLAGDSNNPSRLYYSKSLHPESFPSTYYWDIGRDDGDEITGIFVNLGALIIFKKYSTWVLTGDTPTGANADMVKEKVNPTIGCISAKTAVHAGNDMFFLTPNLGVHRLHRIILAETESFDAEALTEKIQPTIDGLNKDRLIYAHGVSYNHKYYLFVPNGTSNYPDIALVLDLRDMHPDREETIAWTIYDNMEFTSSCWYLDSEGEHIYVGSDSTGYTYELESGTNDDGASIVAYATTKYFDMGSFIYPKILRILAVHGRASEDYEFTIRQFVLYKGVENQYTTTFRGGGVVSSSDVLWDDVVFDDVLFNADVGYTSTVLDILKTAYLTKPAHKLKLKIEDVSANQEFAFYGYEIKGFIGYSRPQG